MELTKKSLLKLCRELDLYSTPQLNDKLYLHQQGISKIQNLDEYIDLSMLYRVDIYLPILVLFPFRLLITWLFFFS